MSARAGPLLSGSIQAKRTEMTNTTPRARYALEFKQEAVRLVDGYQLEQVQRGEQRRGFGTSSEYVRELIRKDQERVHLRGLLLAGASSRPAAPADDTYFAALRDRIGSRTAA